MGSNRYVVSKLIICWVYTTQLDTNFPITFNNVLSLSGIVVDKNASTSANNGSYRHAVQVAGVVRSYTTSSLVVGYNAVGNYYIIVGT